MKARLSHTWIRILPFLALLILSFTTAQAQNRTPETVIVNMVSKGPGVWRFEPAAVTVQPGDTLRFVQKDTAPHNVQFKDAPKGARLDDIRVGPFLLAVGQTYDLVIDDRFVPGEYRYVCTPHEMLGMKGSFKVLQVSPTHATRK